jgi:hypothetical protein
MDAANHGMAFLTRDLTITITGDELTADYKVTALADSRATSTTESDSDTAAGDDLVNNILGQILIGEFHYGITGHQLQAFSLTFDTPQVQIGKDSKNRLIATIDVKSDFFRLNTHRQQITILPPTMGVIGGPTTTAVQLKAPAVQISGPVRVKVGSIANGAASLQVNLSTIRQRPTRTSWCRKEAHRPAGLTACGQSAGSRCPSWTPPSTA